MDKKTEERWRSFWLQKVCCNEFVDYILSDIIQWMEGWYVLDDAGRWILYEIKYCPFCGEELTQGPYNIEEISHVDQS